MWRDTSDIRAPMIALRLRRNDKGIGDDARSFVTRWTGASFGGLRRIHANSPSKRGAWLLDQLLGISAYVGAVLSESWRLVPARLQDHRTGRPDSRRYGGRNAFSFVWRTDR